MSSWNRMLHFEGPQNRRVGFHRGLLLVCKENQGPYGHQRRKPTGWATEEPPKLLRGPGTGVAHTSHEGSHKDENGWESSSWAKWASGMIDLLIDQLRGQGCDKLRKAEINWSEHIASGHWPPFRQCRTCITASARHRAHRRIAHPSSWTLLLETIGPFRSA